MFSCCSEPLDLRIESKKTESRTAWLQEDFRGGYGNSSFENASFHYVPNGNITDTTPYTARQCADLHHESPMLDEGFDETFIPEEKLPYFTIIQQPTDSDRESHSSHSFSSDPKEKKKSIKKSLPPVEKERRKPGRKPGQVSNVLHLWEFIRDLLHSIDSQGIIDWISKEDGVFHVKNSTEVARLWGEKKKNKKQMTYEKLSRSLRYSRLEGYFANLPKDKNYPKKLCFKFGPKSKNWR
uniref:ETS domain-containing protein n=1 Tax=Arion vulgaris TaxID=1028688 RepID=A0A0B6ZIL1_9EUPU